MLPLSRRTDFSEPPTATARALIPVGATAVASLVALFPVVASTPLLPPLGLMTLVAWRLLRADACPLWVALPLGAWDDLLSGAPIGTAICGWTAVLLALDVIDGRMPWRDNRTDWAIASGVVAAMLFFSLLIARNAGSDAGVALLAPQVVLSALLFPSVSRVCAMLDRWRIAR